MFKLFRIKKEIGRIYPQFKRYNFRVWATNLNNIYHIQCYVNNEFYGHIFEFDSISKKLSTFITYKEAGQFQVYINEYRKKTRKNMLKDNNLQATKKIKRNTRINEYINGDKSIIL